MRIYFFNKQTAVLNNGIEKWLRTENFKKTLFLSSLFNIIMYVVSFVL